MALIMLILRDGLGQMTKNLLPSGIHVGVSIILEKRKRTKQEIQLTPELVHLIRYILGNLLHLLLSFYTSTCFDAQYLFRQNVTTTIRFRPFKTIYDLQIQFAKLGKSMSMWQHFA